MEHDTIGRFGTISAVDPVKHMARVEFPELGIVSGWLPVGIQLAGKDRAEAMPDIGEHVYCMMQENTGIILCSVYDTKNLPETGRQEVKRIKFEDGTEILYDKEKHELSITDSYGSSIIMDENGIYGASAKYLTISDTNGNRVTTEEGGMSLTSSKNLRITDGSGGVISMGSGGISITSPKGVNVQDIKGLKGISGAAMSIASGGAMSLTAAGNMNLNAGRYNFS